MKRYVILFFCYMSTLFGCTGDRPCPSFEQNIPAIQSMPAGALSVQSDSLSDSKMIPARYTCDGENISPDIRWKWKMTLPNIQSYAVLVTSDEWYGVNLGINPSAVDQSHWVVFNIPPTITALEEGVSINGSNGTELRKYQGPRCSMITKNKTAGSTYAFTVYALSAALDPSKIQTKDDLIVAMQGHIVASGTITKTYAPQQK